MNRTDRLYALVEELRAVSPRPRSASWLARRFEVSVRTVERDLEALRQTGVPIRSDVGRAGGYSLDRERTLPPVTLTDVEALAVSVALRTTAAPFAAAARRAGQKVSAVLPDGVRRREEALAGRVWRVGGQQGGGGAAGEVIGEAMVAGRVVRLRYADRAGVETARDVEPLGLLWGPHGWYLVGWCRLRVAVRGFQFDRIVSAEMSVERVEPREREWVAELERLDADPLTS
ncbi:WYL domain-containing protein [Umezawaea sp. Da 62-37]|uniref:helix-turn-helix transcriptional regulator n=1 Tax=Umezawaea sp. Da 62-37 TaxID=3075927 RepID=UPI0028F7219D|nr:WYL domain-containing protein [Umezawaea sp. Da 62-37]WNV88023.1 WYL domain-containing protein [Umezawaea sp. Da 62-37]